MYWPYLVNFVVRLIFDGATIIVALLLMVMLFRLPIKFVDRKTLFRAINCTLLLGAIIYILSFIIKAFIAYFSQVEYEQYAIINRVFGPYWFAWLIASLGTFILPQLLWIKRFRKSIITTVLILLFYKLSAVLEFLSIYFLNKSSWAFVRITQTCSSEILVQMVVYILILSITYFIIFKADSCRKEKLNNA